MSIHSRGDLLVGCPTCGRRMSWSLDNKYRPFCSERCRLIDLGQWAAERYRLPGEAIDEEQKVDEAAS